MRDTDFKQRFGLDWLKGEIKERLPRSDLPPEMEDAIIAYSRPLLAALKNSPDHTSRMFDLARNLKLRVDTVAPVMKYLCEKNHVRVTASDDLGNDTFTLTREGERLLNAVAPQ